jgi:hypothetical protein
MADYASFPLVGLSQAPDQEYDQELRFEDPSCSEFGD